jgi:hypothetical protein
MNSQNESIVKANFNNSTIQFNFPSTIGEYLDIDNSYISFKVTSNVKMSPNDKKEIFCKMVSNPTITFPNK